MMLLELDRIDLGMLQMALEDHSPESEWWLDPETGGVMPYLGTMGDDDVHPAERGWVRVEPIETRVAYADMEGFAEGVGEARARDLLQRAITGRGAFRRFKDTLQEFPDLRERWFHFHDVRMRRRAIAWLRDEKLIAGEMAERSLAELEEPDELEPGGSLDASEIARAVAADLQQLYGDRLKEVILFGSWARGDAHPESDIDLLVVLDHVSSRARELDRMDPVLWHHSLANHAVVTEIPVSERELEESEAPLLARIRAEGVPVA